MSAPSVCAIVVTYNRHELLVECLPLFAELRELARARFDKRAAFILAAVDEYEAAIRALAGLGGGRIAEDRRAGAGGCPACGTAITKFREVIDAKNPDPGSAAWRTRAQQRLDELQKGK